MTTAISTGARSDLNGAGRRDLLVMHKVEKGDCVYGWLEMRASRYTPAKDIGSADFPPLFMDYAVGPAFRQVADT